MDGSENIQSDSTEPQIKEDTDRGSFFKKYTLLTPQEPGTVDEPLFKKYVPPRIDSNENSTDQPSVEEPHSLGGSDPGETITKGAWRRTPIQVWWGVAGAILILAGWIILNTILHTQERSTLQIEGNKPPSAGETASDVGANASAPIESTPFRLFDPASADSIDEKSENTSRPARSQPRSTSSSELLHNMMLARAREFEDRGMLLRAEEQYRAAANSFPDDTFSQFGLRRVRAILSTRQQNEMSGVSRELGLKEFIMADFASAERDLAAAVNAGRSDTATLYALGMTYVKRGSYAKAKMTLEHCIAVTPDYAPALVGLAQANAATGKTDQALPLLQRALELGGGAEFTPAKIKEMISRLAPEPAAPSSVLSLRPPQRSQPTFFARALHGHDFPLTWCSGELEIVNSVVHFNASNPSHSFQVLASGVTGARVAGKELHLNVNGKVYRFKLNGRSARDFLDALVPLN